MKEIFQDDDRYVELKIVPQSLRNIIFVVFHGNPIDGHLNAYRTYHKIRQCYFWPGMFQYVKRMCQTCPGCSLSNLTKNRSADLVYSFPIEAPMKVLFVDIYAAGAEFNFVCTKHYLIAACGVTSFVISSRGHSRTKFHSVCRGLDEDLAALWIFSHNCGGQRQQILGRIYKDCAIAKYQHTCIVWGKL